MTETLVLASGSAIRAKILSDIGLDFDIIKPDVDEASLKKTYLNDGESLEKLVAALADAKALAVTAPISSYVIGSDQIMVHSSVLYDKPVDMDEAFNRLKLLQGDTHKLINAVTIVKEGRVLHRILQEVCLTMHKMTDEEIKAYLAEAGPAILSSVGAYQVERLGARLFDKIEGDYFTVLGLSVFPLLKFLRSVDYLDY